VSAAHVLILHPEAAADAGRLTTVVAEARAHLAVRHRDGFVRAGAATATIVSGPPDDRPFGARLRDVLPTGDRDGLVVLGSGAVPLLTATDRRRFVAVAATGSATALANNRFSADILAIGCARAALATLPDLPTDNALPRWLAERAGYAVDDLRARWRLGVDIDGPLDLVLLGGRWAAAMTAHERARVEARLAAARAVVTDPRAEVVVAGRTSLDALAWLARSGAARTRALVEERGLRTGEPGQRPPASVLGALLDLDGPEALGAHLARLGEAAIVDTRVLLAHRLGADEGAWPPTEDRSASDLLLHERIADRWLRALTLAAVEAPIPVVLGGHTLVGPGLRLALRA
jgi:hypothetical protein